MKARSLAPVFLAFSVSQFVLSSFVPAFPAARDEEMELDSAWNATGASTNSHRDSNAGANFRDNDNLNPAGSASNNAGETAGATVSDSATTAASTNLSDKAAATPNAKSSANANNAAQKGSSDLPPPSDKVLKGQVDYCVPSGTPLKLKLATVPTHAVHMMDRDLDGKLLPAKAGQEITAKVAEDLYIGENKVIPEGTIFHGKVSEIVPPRRLHRPGSVKLTFDSLRTPDGRTFAFRAQADNFKKSTMKTKAKGFGRVMAYAGGGGIVGALVAYQVFGLHYTIAMHGYNIAGGAAAGALLATGYAMMQKGDAAVLEPGDDLHLQIDSDLLMPAAAEPKPKAPLAVIPGFSMKIRKGKLIKDGLDGYILMVDATVNNEGDARLSSIDLFLEDSNGTRSPITTEPGDKGDDSQLLFTIDPHSSTDIHLAFQVEYPKLKRELVWLEHESRKIAFRAPLP